MRMPLWGPRTANAPAVGARAPAFRLRRLGAAAGDPGGAAIDIADRRAYNTHLSLADLHADGPVLLTFLRHLS